MLHRQFVISEKQTTYQQAERQAEMMNQITLLQFSPFLQLILTQVAAHTPFWPHVASPRPGRFGPRVRNDLTGSLLRANRHSLFARANMQDASNGF